MRWVDQATVRPNRCAVIPYIGNGSGHSFIDTQQDLDREHVYISDAAAESIAQMLGWAPPQTLAQEREANRSLQAQVGELQAEVETLTEEREHVAALVNLDTGDWQIRKPQGRKPEKKKEPESVVNA